MNRGFTARADRGETIEFERGPKYAGNIEYVVEMPGQPEHKIKIEKEAVRVLEGLEEVSEKAAANNLVEKYLEKLELDETDLEELQDEEIEGIDIEL